MRVLPWAAFGLVKIFLGVFRAALGNLFKNKVQINTLKETAFHILLQVPTKEGQHFLQFSATMSFQ